MRVESVVEGFRAESRARYHPLKEEAGLGESPAGFGDPLLHVVVNLRHVFARDHLHVPH